MTKKYTIKQYKQMSNIAIKFYSKALGAASASSLSTQ